MKDRCCLSKIKEAKEIIIYGAHAIAKDLWKYLEFHEYKHKVIGFAVSAIEGNPKKIDTCIVREIAYYKQDYKEALILIATPEKFFSEIEETLEQFGFHNFIGLGNWGLASLENEDVLAFMNKYYPQFNARQDVYEALCIKLTIKDKDMRLMPLAAYPFDDEVISYFNHIDKDVCLLEKLSLIKEENSTEDCMQDKDIAIYIVSSLMDLQFKQKNECKDWEYPIIAGAVLASEIDEQLFLQDDKGDNISKKNLDYAEMTAVYWAWKNSSATYKGIGHYRRRYILEERDVCELKQGKYDVILTTPRLVVPSVRRWFVEVSSLNPEDIEMVEKCILDIFPECQGKTKQFFDGHILYPNNMIVARADIYDRYCCWIFSILEMLENGEQYQVIRSRRRYAAYVAELLTSFYFLYIEFENKMKVVDYKLEENGGKL